MVLSGYASPEIKYAYLLRRIDDNHLYEFIADADANYNLPEYVKSTITDLSPFGELDESAAPGVRYLDYDFLMEFIFSKPHYGVTFDQWGEYISGLAAIYSKDGKGIAILGVDADIWNKSH